MQFPSFMEDSQIKAYMDYWMDNDDGFSNMLDDDDERVVTGVDYYGEAFPRAVITFTDNLILLFPEFNPNFKYE